MYHVHYLQRSSTVKSKYDSFCVYLMNINANKSVVCICYECIPDAESLLKGNLSIYFWCFTLILHVNLFLIYFTFLLKVGEGGYGGQMYNSLSAIEELRNWSSITCTTISFINGTPFVDFLKIYSYRLSWNWPLVSLKENSRPPLTFRMKME